MGKLRHIFDIVATLGMVNCGWQAKIMYDRHQNNVISTGYAFRINGGQHWWTSAKLNGRDSLMMLDSGSSDIALSPDQAKEYRVRMTKRYGYYEIADGRLLRCPIGYVTFQVGDVKLDHVRASVCRKDSKYTLLGQSVLNRLRVTMEGTTAKLELMGEKK